MPEGSKMCGKNERKIKTHGEKSMINDGTIHYTSYVNLRPSVIHG